MSSPQSEKSDCVWAVFYPAIGLAEDGRIKVVWGESFDRLYDEHGEPLPGSDDRGLCDRMDHILGRGPASAKLRRLSLYVEMYGEEYGEQEQECDSP